MGDYTTFISVKMDEWADVIYDIEDHLASLEDNIPALMDYLKDLRYSMPLGLGLRRYFCSHYGKKTEEGLLLRFPDGTERAVRDLMSDGYDIQTDDLKTYTDLFLAVNREKNGTLLEKEFPRAEVNRLLRHTSACTRAKMFLISFALQMNAEDMHWFLTDVLMEQTYNMRSPAEIIAYYCQTSDKSNSYAEYLRLCERFPFSPVAQSDSPEQTEGYTALARSEMTVDIRTEAALMHFLEANRQEFAGYSRTAYAEYRLLVERAMACSEIQRFASDEYLSSQTVADPALRARQEELITRSIEIRPAENTEQLARAMLSCIPRATREYERNGKKIVENDFIPVFSGDSGRSNGKKVQTTLLPKEITMNLLMKDRLDDLLARKKPVERKDLVFLRFYIFCMKLQKKEEYSSRDYLEFLDECNAMLSRCGMANLYPANRFENLILLSLVSSNPFEMFESIVDASFINDTGVAPDGE